MIPQVTLLRCLAQKLRMSYDNMNPNDLRLRCLLATRLRNSHDNMDPEISGSVSVGDKTREQQRFVYGQCVEAAKTVLNSIVYVLFAAVANSPS